MEEQNNNGIPTTSVGKAPQEAATPTASNTTPPPASSPSPEKSGGMGPMMGIGIIVILLIFGGLYFWGAQLNEQKQLDESLLFDPTLNEDIADKSSEPAAIENDLDEFNTLNFDAELEADLEAMEAEL